MKKFCLLLLLTFVCTGVSHTYADDYGNLTGKIIYKGEAPATTLINVAGKDPAVCGVKPIFSEELVVDPATGGIANCIIWLKNTPANIHPSLKEPAKKEVKFDNINCVFVPHCLVVQTTQAVHGVNSDACSHNIKTNMMKNKGENPILGPNNQEGHLFTFTTKEIVPMSVECSIHAWMRAHWLVIDHPYAVVTDKEGKFEIKNLPVGEHTLMIWQEKAGLKIKRNLKVNIEAGKTTDITVEADAAAFN